MDIPTNARGTFELAPDSSAVSVGADADVIVIARYAGKLTLTLGDRAKVCLLSVRSDSGDVARDVDLAGTGASYDEHDIFFGTGQDAISFATKVVNTAPDTKASVSMRGVLDDASKAVCTGTMTVRKGAKKARSHLSQHVLLLSNDAKAENFPYLEIHEHDVQASHAATVRPVDADQLFYLRTRGMPEGDARQALVTGFLLPGLDKPLQDLVRGIIGQKVRHVAAQ